MRECDDANASGGLIDFGSADTYGAFSPARSITFNADVVALARGPSLEVAADGTITADGTVNTVDGNGNTTSTDVVINGGYIAED